jgi:glucose-1-phosphate thymidylyltransferase
MSALLLAGIREIVIISPPEYIDNCRGLFGPGEELGLALSYAVQPAPRAFLIGADFLAGDPAALVLGNYVFLGRRVRRIDAARHRPSRPRPGYGVRLSCLPPAAYGVVELDADWRAVSREEKPAEPKSGWALDGLYFYDQRAVELAACLKRPPPTSTEFAWSVAIYSSSGWGGGYTWLDTGTRDSSVPSAEREDRYNTRVSGLIWRATVRCECGWPATVRIRTTVTIPRRSKASQSQVPPGTRNRTAIC